MQPWQKQIIDWAADDSNVDASQDRKRFQYGRQSGKSAILSDALSAYVECFNQLAEQERMQTATRQELIAAGWLPVECTEYFHKNWAECHDQCVEVFGKENYTWTGEIFWFKDERDIFKFKLMF
jgi:hypothetical protein